MSEKRNGNGNGNGNGKAHGAAKPAKATKSAATRGVKAKASPRVRARTTSRAASTKGAAPRESERAFSSRGRPTRGGTARLGPRPKGTLIIVGGHEDKKGDKLILTELANRIGSGKLVVATVASDVPGELWEDYEPLFRGLGIRHVHHLEVASRGEAKSAAKLRILDDAVAVFFTGGDQLKITSQLGDSPIYERIREIYDSGGIIAGTSAGASVVCETMMVSGAGSESHRIGSSLTMAAGFGLIAGVIIDQHFAQRGRIGRLIGAVAQNPRMLGIGIDEDTAILCHPDNSFEVIGKGAVYVVDGQDITYTNLTEEEQDRTLSTFNLRVHILSMGDRFDMTEREPSHRAAEELEREILAG